jgi:hypothetical protein
MFEALAIVCAASLSFEIYTDRCFMLQDSWGPYNTIENCNIRRSQMVNEVLNGVLSTPVFTILGFPEQIHVESICRSVEQDIST